MAFLEKGWRLWGYGGTFPSGAVQQYFSFGTNDAAAVVEGSNYFNSVANQVRKGDLIFASMVNGGTPVFKTYIVTSATGAATVTIALQAVTAG